MRSWPRRRRGAPARRAPLRHRPAADVALGTETRAWARPRPTRELTLPYHGERLRGDDLRRQLDAWVAAGVVEPIVRRGRRGASLDNPDWLRLEGRTVAVLGAGAEMGPLPSLLRWGARVAAVDLPRPELWERVLDAGRRSPAPLVVPVPAGRRPATSGAGADLLAEVPAVAEWLAELERAARGRQLRLRRRRHQRARLDRRRRADRRVVEAQRRDDVALAFLATPDRRVRGARRGRRHSDASLRAARRAVQGARPPAAHAERRAGCCAATTSPGADPGINDSLVPQQGPNYALAKRLQRWRATVARDDGRDGLDERRPADPHPVGGQEPRARRGVRGRAPLRRRGLRARPPPTC